MTQEDSTKAGYKYLLTYQYASVIYDLTVEFCQNFLQGRELLRQRDQMVQAARSGKQNIVEGYELNSLESYIRFIGIASGSLKELLEDYEDYLRQRKLTLWGKDSEQMMRLREVRVMADPFPHIPQFPHIPPNPEGAANVLVMLCQRTTYLLKKQSEKLEKKFVDEGGFRENLFKKRLNRRE